MKKLDYKKIHAFEEAEGLPLTVPTAKHLAYLKARRILQRVGATLRAISILGCAAFGLYEWWRPGAPPPSPPLPAHIYAVRDEPGLWVVDHGYSFLRRVVCRYLGGEEEPRVEAIPGGKEMITCVAAYEGESGSYSFKYSAAQEYTLSR